MKQITFLIIILLSTLLAGCLGQSGDVKVFPNEKDIRIYTFKGKPLECIKVGYGMSCNWEKYNSLGEGE